MNFSDFDLSILGEIGNVSVGGAAASLSDFVNKVVTISIPDTKILTFKELKEKFEPAVVFAKIDYTQGLAGSNMLILKKEEAVDLSKVVVKEKLNMDLYEWDDFSKNVIAEIFNIMAGNMSASMSEVLNKNIKILTPQVNEVKSSELDYFPDDEKLITVWFEVKIENIYKLRLVKIITKSQGEEMINLIKGENHL